MNQQRREIILSLVSLLCLGVLVWMDSWAMPVHWYQWLGTVLMVVGVSLAVGSTVRRLWQLRH